MNEYLEKYCYWYWKIIDVEDDDNDENCGVSSAVLSASMSSFYDASTGCDGRDGHQILRVAGNILNKQQRTSDKSCPPVWWLDQLLTTQHHNSLMCY